MLGSNRCRDHVSLRTSIGKGSLADEYIVIGAHYDHIGYGHFGSRSNAKNVIHPGADDNASGTSAVILAARQLKQRYDLLDETDNARSIVFLLFTAEESGLHGSRYYTEHPIAPIENHEIMLNMDMIGRLESDPLEIGGYNSSKELAELASTHLNAYGMVYSAGTSVGEGRSDHANFEAKDIPNMFFFTGLHDEYHTPADTLDLLDLEGGTHISVVCSQIAYDAATSGTDFIHSSDFGPNSHQETKQPKVRVGVIPSDARNGGIKIDRVFDDTSASDAGLQRGDRITHWDGTKIDNIESWAPLLVEHSPGDEITVTIVRDDETIEIEMTLRGIE